VVALEVALAVVLMYVVDAGGLVVLAVPDVEVLVQELVKAHARVVMGVAVHASPLVVIRVIVPVRAIAFRHVMTVVIKVVLDNARVTVQKYVKHIVKHSRYFLKMYLQLRTA
jgi:hypothetical protein